MLRAALFVIVANYKQHKCPSAVEQINQMLYIYTAGYYVTIKKSEVLIHVTMWMKLKI